MPKNPLPSEDPDDVFADYFGRGKGGVDRGERYLVEMASLVVAIFKRCEGLESRRDVLEVEEGGRERPHARLGPYAEGAFRLAEGEADAVDLYEWYERGLNADHLASSRRNGCVILVDGRGLEIARWKFKAGKVTGWDGPAERPTGGRPYAIDAIEVAHEGVETVVRDR